MENPFKLKLPQNPIDIILRENNLDYEYLENGLLLFLSLLVSSDSGADTTLLTREAGELWGSR